MNNGVENLSLVSLSLAFIPVVVVLVMMCRWSLGAGNAAYAVIRMLVQCTLSQLKPILGLPIRGC